MTDRSQPNSGMTCYERDEDLCDDQVCLSSGCKLRNERLRCSPDSDLSRAWDMLMVLAVTPPYEWLSKAEIHQAIQWMRVVGKPSPAPAQSSDDQIEAACSAYAKATDYYVEFHRGLSSESSDRMRKGMRAALSVVFTNAQGAHMTVASIEAAFDEWCNTLTVVDRPSNQQIFSQGYVAGWNAKEAAPPQAAPIMQAAEKAAKTVEGWSDAKRDYAQRVMGDTPPQAAPSRDEIARIIDEHAMDTVKMHGRQNASKHAVRCADMALAKADAILKTLSRPERGDRS